MAETKATPRDICQLINAMRLFVPLTEQALLERFEAVYSSAMYSAPELQHLRWDELQDVIIEYFPTITTASPEWEKTVICLFSNTTRHKCDEILAREQATAAAVKEQHGPDDSAARCTDTTTA